jgi:hypothetical protein
MSTLGRAVSSPSPLLSFITSLSRDFRRRSLVSTFLAELSLPSDDTLPRECIEREDLLTPLKVIALVCRLSSSYLNFERCLFCRQCEWTPTH